MIKYLSVSEARSLPGLRLVLTAGGVAAPWGDAAKAFFRLHRVPFVPVEQIPFEANEELVAWTGIRNAPIAVYGNEPPRAGWLEIALLAERLGSGPSLFPVDSRQRALCLGIATEIAGEEGFGWTCRMLSLKHLFGAREFSHRQYGGAAEACHQYRFSQNAAAASIPRLIEVMRGLSAQLAEQQARGSDYLVGDQLSVADVLWAFFSMFVAPPDASVCAMPEWQRDLYAANASDIGESIDQLLLDHRDRMLDRHIGIPWEL